MNMTLVRKLKSNWFSIRVIVAGVIMATLTFVFCYLYFNYEVKVWTLEDYNRGYTKVKYGNQKSNSECIFALFINKRR